MYIAFEGLIGSGKTTLAKLLAKHIGADLMLEDFANNQFLSDFYANPKRWALGMQLWFLAERTKQLGSIHRPLPKHLVADHSLGKDQVFASTILTDRELNLYQQLHIALKKPIFAPDLVVMLDASNDVLLQRISGRNRTYESAIDAEYLHALRNSYRDNYNPDGAQILRVDTSDLNLSSEEQLTALFHSILEAPTVSSGAID